MAGKNLLLRTCHTLIRYKFYIISLHWILESGLCLPRCRSLNFWRPFKQNFQINKSARHRKLFSRMRQIAPSWAEPNTKLGQIPFLGSEFLAGRSGSHTPNLVVFPIVKSRPSFLGFRSDHRALVHIYVYGCAPIYGKISSRHCISRDVTKYNFYVLKYKKGCIFIFKS